MQTCSTSTAARSSENSRPGAHIRLVVGTVVAALIAVRLGATVGTQREPTTFDDEIKPISFEDLAYPAVAQDAMIQGVVVVSAELDESGNVTDAKALSGQRMLVAAAAANVKRWKFVPNARKNVVIVYDFRIEGICNKARPTLFRLRHPNFAQITACGSQIQAESSGPPQSHSPA
jgi:TonB family protein